MIGQTLPDGIISRSFQLNLKKPLVDFKIRNGRLWGRNSANHLVCINLNVRPSPPIKEFTEIGDCNFYSSSPDGEHCFIKTVDNKNYIINGSTLVGRQALLFPGNNATAVSWLYFKNLPKPYVFIATDKKQLCYFNLNQQLFACSAVVLNPELKGPVEVFSLVQFADNRIGASFIVGDNIYPYVFINETFMQIENDNQRSTTIYGFNKNANPYFVENEYLAISTPMIFYNIVLDPKQVNVTGVQMHKNAAYYQVDPKANKVAITNNVIFQFKGNQVSFFVICPNPVETAVDSITIPNADIFELDTYSAVLYSLSEKTVTSYQFSSKIVASGFDNFRYWLYFRLIEQRKESIAAAILSQSSASFDQIISLSRNQSNNLRLEVFKKFLENVKHIHKMQRTAIALCALDIYVRIESSATGLTPEEKEERIEEFIKWANHLIEQKVLTSSIIEKALIEYDWTEAHLQYLQPPAAFDMKMQLGEYSEAREQLKKIRDPEMFCDAALRLSKFLPDEVYSEIIDRNDALSGKMIPLMMSDQYLPHLKQLFAAGRLISPWLRRIFALYMAREPHPQYITQYFGLYPSDTQVLIRSLFSAKHYMELANGIRSIQYFEDLLPSAVGIAAYGSPELAFDLIPENVSLTLKRRCALRILRSMKREDAEAVAKKLLSAFSGIDIATLIEFLPESATVAEVSKAIYRYSAKNQMVALEEKKKSDEALKGIADSNELVSSKPPNIVRLYKYHGCSRCGRPLLNEQGIVYPCSHALHRHCAEEACVGLNTKPGEYIDVTLDCPICGFLCMRMMSEPFEPERGKPGFIDPWAVDEFTLSQIY
ncbi:hypothetical protein TRFO_42872 [Tritrichomonas foetus]|uniref:RING-type domain-containing protein n=1 Tax=Tritrichomonas foetus TaxID=1144522 RepID=A0A1J4KV87_9EUKA|nr:hypothetical protein TRFO_42872 [Tritrichomonas foetus]|eukprot:OHT14808.1 hypothetical protein TRFO_42872 [Tritrichomonas foetus]